MKKTTSCVVAFAILFFAPNRVIFAQTVKMTANCGDVLESEFKNSIESQDIEIFMNAGDSFEVMAVPVGDHLKIWAEIYDPGNALAEPEEPTDIMFNDETVRSLTLNSGVVSSNGKYRIRLYNSLGGHPDNTGVYNTYIKCIKRNGDIINPK